MSGWLTHTHKVGPPPHVNNNSRLGGQDLRYAIPHFPSCRLTSTPSRSVLMAWLPHFRAWPWAPYPRWPSQIRPWTLQEPKPQHKPQPKLKPNPNIDMKPNMNASPNASCPTMNMPTKQATKCTNELHHRSLTVQKCCGLNIGKGACNGHPRWVADLSSGKGLSV